MYNTLFFKHTNHTQANACIYCYLSVICIVTIVTSDHFAFNLRSRAFNYVTTNISLKLFLNFRILLS